jgi:hypothetical protein
MDAQSYVRLFHALRVPVLAVGHLQSRLRAGGTAQSYVRLFHALRGRT